MRRLLWALLFMAAAGASAALAGETHQHARTHPHQSGATTDIHLLVKLRASSAPTTAPGAAVPSPHDRIVALTRRNGLTLDVHRPITRLLHAIHVQPAPSGEPVQAMLARLRSDPAVEYAELDQRRYIHAVAPNDPLYSQQWFLQAVTSSTASAIDATDAWSTTTGSNTLVIADIDTGVRSDHPDLAGRLLTGYCFITDSFVANGGNCPGSGAEDPGDWVTSSDLSQSQCSGASAEPSSWHGTRVAGILGAITNNAVGVAGVSWASQLLPVRALGKCGGDDSDILSGMLWAAGISVSGAPDNAKPARIINMSIGGTGSCPSSYQDAISQITALGVLIVASAGNEGGPVDAPANCPGVAAIGGLRQAGTKVGYSNLGPQVTVSAPAGNCSDSFTGGESPCVYTLTTTTNLGYQQPDADDYIGEYFCDPTTGSYSNCTLANSNQYRTYNIGTSFSAPLVSSISALMVSVNSNLSSCELISRLQEGSVAFPQSSLDTTPQPAMCHAPASSTDDSQATECICTRDDQTCGAGMANAPGALAAALRPIAAVAVPASVSAGQTVTLDGSGSAAANSHTITTYQWSPVSGGLSLALQNATKSTATVSAPSCGIATVSLTVTDDAGRTDAADVVITPSAVTTIAPAKAGQGSCSLTTSVQLAVCPAAANVQTGSGSETFSATLANTTNTAVTWQVNGVTGGNATLGTISSAGVYRAPASVPSPATVSVSAVSAADSSVSDSASVTITAPPSGGGGVLDPTTLAAGTALLVVALRRRMHARGVRPGKSGGERGIRTGFRPTVESASY
jgi:serine protease